MAELHAGAVAAGIVGYSETTDTALGTVTDAYTENGELLTKTDTSATTPPTTPSEAGARWLLDDEEQARGNIQYLVWMAKQADVLTSGRPDVIVTRMKGATKRATVYFDPEIHRALRLKSAATERTISEGAAGGRCSDSPILPFSAASSARRGLSAPAGDRSASAVAPL